MYKINKDSIVSFGKYIKKYPYSIKCYFIGWASKDKYWAKIETTIKENIPEEYIYKIVRKKENFGKAYVVNEALQDIKNLDFEYFFTCDSDICFLEDEPNIFERLTDTAFKLDSVHNKIIGFIANDQKGHCCHIYNKLNNEVHVLGYNNITEILAYSAQEPGWIAGGSLFISKSAWFDIGGYKQVAVYGADDGQLHTDFRKKFYICYVAKSISVYHPSTDDEVYQNWKTSTCTIDIEKNKLDYDKLKQKADLFWSENKI